ncbi:MAG: hypothetical protein ABI442_15185 [Gemmatimonadaceae bacterium]
MPAQPFPLDAALASKLTDARLQTHHAAQFAAAIGISYVPPQFDDSHTNLGWISELGALTSHMVASERPFHLGVRVADLTLLLVGEEFAVADSLPLHGRTIAAAAEWIRSHVTARGADASRFTLDKHYSIPMHAVAHGTAFDTGNRAAFDQLSRWFASASEILNGVRESHDGKTVRCWPHHFDIATVLDVGAGATIGIGMEPGDTYYDEPYYYAIKHPQPASPPGVMLAGKGHWHEHEWIGAVLSGSNVNAADQRGQIQSFINSAIASY